jgi:hypothetical protein
VQDRVVHLQTKDSQISPHQCATDELCKQKQGIFHQLLIQKSKKAKKLFHAPDISSTADFKAILPINLILYNPIIIEDIELAEQIFKLDTRTLKGKTTCKTPKPVANNFIVIPHELTTKQHNIVLCIDSIKVNGVHFLTTISKNIFYRTAQ